VFLALLWNCRAGLYILKNTSSPRGGYQLMSFGGKIWLGKGEKKRNMGRKKDNRQKISGN
jgi:hypothetical protein